MSHKVRLNEKKADPFRSQPGIRRTEKSRRHYPVSQTEAGYFCIRAYQCRNRRRCAECVPLFRLWKERK